MTAPPLGLRALFGAYYASIWRLLRRLGVPQAQLDDAAQEVFWVAARKLDQIEPGKQHAFLYGVALRVAASEVRRHSSPCLSCRRSTSTLRSAISWSLAMRSDAGAGDVEVASVRGSSAAIRGTA